MAPNSKTSSDMIVFCQTLTRGAAEVLTGRVRDVEEEGGGTPTFFNVRLILSALKLD